MREGHRKVYAVRGHAGLVEVPADVDAQGGAAVLRWIRDQLGEPRIGWSDVELLYEATPAGGGAGWTGD
ncbi:MAG: hypothetical protein K6U87_14085 [Firmicutes bacterium]|nr:hypothetical protein [Bacillota bacterium]